MKSSFHSHTPATELTRGHLSSFTFTFASRDSVSKSWRRAPSWAHDKVFITVSHLRSCFCEAVFVWFESRGTRDHILLYQIWNFLFVASYDSGSWWKLARDPRYTSSIASDQHQQKTPFPDNSSIFLESYLPRRWRETSQFLNCSMRVHFRGQFFTEPLPSKTYSGFQASHRNTFLTTWFVGRVNSILHKIHLLLQYLQIIRL
jgi:hypothetical protein